MIFLRSIQISAYKYETFTLLKHVMFLLAIKLTEIRQQISQRNWSRRVCFPPKKLQMLQSRWRIQKGWSWPLIFVRIILKYSDIEQNMIKISLIRPGNIKVSCCASLNKSLKRSKFDAISILTNSSGFPLLQDHIQVSWFLFYLS